MQKDDEARVLNDIHAIAKSLELLNLDGSTT